MGIGFFYILFCIFSLLCFSPLCIFFYSGDTYSNDLWRPIWTSQHCVEATEENAIVMFMATTALKMIMAKEKFRDVETPEEVAAGVEVLQPRIQPKAAGSPVADQRATLGPPSGEPGLGSSHPSARGGGLLLCGEDVFGSWQAQWFRPAIF